MHARKHGRAALFLGVVLGFTALAGAAQAALTPSELAQIRDAVTSAKSGTTSARVRALVARPDLSDEESTSALAQAVVPVPFTPPRAQLLKDLVFGGASVASRPVLATAVVKSLLARADSLLTKHSLGLDGEAEAIAELYRIYGFLAREIADAPGRRGVGAEPQNGISLAAYDECARAMAAQLEKHPKWLRNEGRLSPAATRLRAQFKLALLDMMNETPTMRVEAADRLGLTGARRSFFTELGILALDSGVADDTRIDRVRAILSRMPGARAGTSAIYFGEAKPDLIARGAVLGIVSSLEAGTGKGQVPASARENIFPDEVEPSAFDPAVVDLARELAGVVVTRALGRRGELRLRADRDVKAAQGDASRLLGKVDLTPESALTGAVTLLLLDGPRTMDVATVRFLAGRPESAALLSDALGVLATHSAAAGASGGLQLAIGRPRDDGSTETLWLTEATLGPDGSARSFVVGGAKWEIVRGESGVVTEMRRGGASANLGMLQTARLAVREGPEWKAGGVVFNKVSGNPRAGLAQGGRVRMSGTHERNLDVIATRAPGPDVSVDLELKVFGGGGAVLVRAAPSPNAYRGAGLFIEPNLRTGMMKVSLRAIADSLPGSDLAPPQEIKLVRSMSVRIVVRGTKIEAAAGSISMKGVLPAALASGDVAIQADRGASVEALGLSIKKL